MKHALGPAVRRVAPLLVGLLLMLLLTGSVAGQSAPPGSSVAPADWIQLASSKYGFALQYPSGSKAVLYEPEAVMRIALPDDAVGLYIRMRENPSEASVADWLRSDAGLRVLATQNDNPVDLSELVDVVVGDVAGVAVRRAAVESDRFRAFVAAEGRIYEIGIPVDQSSGSDSRSTALAQQVVETLELSHPAGDTGFSTVQTLSSPVILGLPVEKYRQFDSRWHCDQLGTGMCGNDNSKTGCSTPELTLIHNKGCAVTALSMLSDWYLDGATPRTLNSCLTSNDKYAACSGCSSGKYCVVWGGLSPCMPSGVEYVNDSSSMIDEDLWSGRPVIATINSGDHYFVITGKKSNGTYSINDPGSSADSPVYPGDIDWVRRYSGTPPPPIATLYDSPYYNGTKGSYWSMGYGDVRSTVSASSLIVQSGLSVILRPSPVGGQTAPCAVFDRNITNFTPDQGAPYYYSDNKTLIDNNVKSIEITDACVEGCDTVTGTSASPISFRNTSRATGACGYSVCDAPALQTPSNNYTSYSSSRSIAFDWDDLPPASCSHNGFNLRVRTGSDMDSGGTVVKDITVQSGTSWTETFSSSWDNQDLFWSVRAANAADGASWATARRFSIHPNSPPSLSCKLIEVGGNKDYWWPAFPESNKAVWRLECTATDPDSGDSVVGVKADCWGFYGDKCYPNVQQALAYSNGVWSYQWSDLYGRNQIQVVASDNHGAQGATSTGVVTVDQAPPTTSIALNGTYDRTKWPTWFTQPVTAYCLASDNGTGSALVGVDRVYYRLDDQLEQEYLGPAASSTVATDGQHTVTCHAVDNVTNSEPPPYPTATFKIDQTPPSWTPSFQEVHNAPPTCVVENGIWQNCDNAPSFAFSPATDPAPGSGLRGYHFYFGSDPNGVSSEWKDTCNPCSLVPQEYVRTGRYYLRGTVCDVAGNCTPWQTYYDFRYDGTPPPNPSSAIHALNPEVINDTWQNKSSLAEFTWPPPVDEGSGVKGYDLYWGSDVIGAPDEYTSEPRYQAAAPLCAADDTCIGYLNIRTIDNVDNVATETSTLFTLRYDNTPPTADFTINNGITMTSQTLVYLEIDALDLSLSGTLAGSGVRDMRLSSDGKEWTDWTKYEEETTWTIPAISRQWWPIYLQVRDLIGLPSEVISHSIYFEVNRPPIKSENFWLLDEARSSGAGVQDSSNFSALSTVGQTVESVRTNSLNYVIVGGYQAGSKALPIIQPGYDTFSLINSIYASGAGAHALRSARFTMVANVGDIGVLNNAPWTSSDGFRLQPGFLAAQPPSIPLTPPCPPGGCNPPPEPPPGNCEFPQITIDNGALFTNSQQVTLSECAPAAVQMMISNDGGFPGAQWEPYAESKSWTISIYGQEVMPRFVYAAFKRADGTIDSVYFDDIIYDPNAPTGNVMIGDGVSATGIAGASTTALTPLVTAADNTREIYMNGRDSNSGVAEMQVSHDSSFVGATWEPYQSVKQWTPTGSDGEQSVYVRFRDNAMNVSGTGSADFLLDREGPTGSLSLSRHVVGPAAKTTELILNATDGVSGVGGVRIGSDPNLDGAIWMAYPASPVWLADLDGPASVPLYAQYRDQAGNLSPIYSDTYIVDKAAPQVQASVAPDDTLTRIVTINATDAPAGPDRMRLSNDPFMLDSVEMAYQPTVEWTFDDRKVVYIQVRDAVGNTSGPVAATAPTCANMAVPVLQSTLDGNDVLVSWPADPVASSYELWISENPYFDPNNPGGLTPIITTETSYRDEGAAVSLTNHYYVVRGKNQCGTLTGSSNRAGEFTFGISVNN